VAFAVESGEVGRYTEVFDQVRRQTLDARQSRTLLSELAMTG
jgi:hypothetical protein